MILVVGVAAAYILTRPSEEEYELFLDYEVGEYYTYNTATTTISTYDNTQTETSSTSTYTMQVTEIEDNEIYITYITTVEENSGEWASENVEITMSYTMTNKGKIISWEVENVVPSGYWENAVQYENQQMIYSQIFENLWALPSDPVSVGGEWDVSISGEMPWGQWSTLVTGEGTAQFVGKKSVTVEAGTFDCWRIDYSGSVSGELTVDNYYTATISMEIEENAWYNKQNCAHIKSATSYTMSAESAYYMWEQIIESATELTEYGTA